MWPDPSRLDPTLDSRSISFENPTGDRGAGGSTFDGRKGAPSQLLGPGARVVLADIEGPGTIRHIWCTVPPAPPEHMRAITLEVFYDDRDEPSVSVPLLDFFGAPLGRRAPYASLLTVVAEDVVSTRTYRCRFANACASNSRTMRRARSSSTSRSTTRSARFPTTRRCCTFRSGVRTRRR
jgi:hypothetical protein